MTKPMTTKAEAEALGISRQSLYTYRKEADWPGEGAIADKLRWIERRQAGVLGLDTAISEMDGDELMLAKRRGEAKLVSEKAIMAELERREKEGELVKADDVASERQRAAVTLQNQLLNLPSETRQRMEAGDEPGAIEAWMGGRLRELINNACDEGMGR